jgi:hypothetical protein
MVLGNDPRNRAAVQSTRPLELERALGYHAGAFLGVESVPVRGESTRGLHAEHRGPNKTAQRATLFRLLKQVKMQGGV